MSKATAYPSKQLKQNHPNQRLMVEKPSVLDPPTCYGSSTWLHHSCHLVPLPTTRDFRPQVCNCCFACLGFTAHLPPWLVGDLGLMLLVSTPAGFTSICLDTPLLVLRENMHKERRPCGFSCNFDLVLSPAVFALV